MSQFIYHTYYNVRFAGLEKFHPFDSCKYEKIAKHLENIGARFIEPPSEVSQEMLETIHTDKYLKKLTYSEEVGKLCEMPFLWWVPNRLLQFFILLLFGQQTKKLKFPFWILINKIGNERERVTILVIIDFNVFF
jgi:hypothetical protein